ncbi:MAG: redoxin domain-containing protein [Phycisphaeraceae bacterium]
MNQTLRLILIALCLHLGLLMAIAPAQSPTAAPANVVDPIVTQPTPDPRAAPEAAKVPDNEADDEENDDEDPSAKLVGMPAPQFALPDLEGKHLSLKDMKGSVVVLDFWATWCGPCIEALPGLDQTYRDLKSHGLTVLAINHQEPAGQVARKAAALKLTMPILLDAQGSVADQYFVTGIPQTVIIGKDGKVAHVFVGSGNDGPIRAAALKELGLTQRVTPVTSLPVVDDEQVMARLVAEGTRLMREKKLVPGEQLAQQLKRVAASPTATPVTGFPVADAAAARVEDLSAAGRRGTLVLAELEHDQESGQVAAWPASGFVVSASGLAITNYHVLEVAAGPGLIAMTGDGRVVAIRSVLAASREYDIALVQLDGQDFTPLAIAPRAAVGSGVAVLSHPDGRFYCLTQGAVARYSMASREEGLVRVATMEVTADYARGSSGGPVLNAAAQVVGMVAATASVYYDDEYGDLQMVVKECVPSEQILQILAGQKVEVIIEKAP